MLRIAKTAMKARIMYTAVMASPVAEAEFGGNERAAAGFEARVHITLLVRHGFEGTEVLHVRRRDGGDKCCVRLHEIRQRQDFAAMVHADLEHAEARIGRQARQCERHAPMVVVALNRAMRFAAGGEAHGQRLLGGGLADGAGDGDALGRAAIACGGAERA